MTEYRGRFAPTPSGPLHLGSLLAALASYLDARACGGVWQVRIEDIDPPRCPPGNDTLILRQLEAFGLHWDGQVSWQHSHHDAYADALNRLIQGEYAYPCSCSRKDWQGHSVYPGWCRHGVTAPGKPLAWRLRCESGSPVTWHDRLFGFQSIDPACLGDVVLKRRDGLYAYQLAVVVDDADQRISDVVRGSDLLDNTPWQRRIQQALGVMSPRYLHLPLVVTPDGQKLSKQNRARPLAESTQGIRRQLHWALKALNQAPLEALADYPPDQQLQWAVQHWSTARLIDRTDRLVPCSDP